MEELKQNTGKPRRDVDGQKLERIKMDCIWVNLKNVDPPPKLRYVSLYMYQRQTVINTAGKSFSVVRWP